MMCYTKIQSLLFKSKYIIEKSEIFLLVIYNSKVSLILILK